jgi:hypothetical protein
MNGKKRNRWALPAAVLLSALLPLLGMASLAADDFDDFDAAWDEDAKPTPVPGSADEISSEDVAKRLQKLREEGQKIRYEPKGVKRDPFISLVIVTTEQKETGTRPPGFEGFDLGELRLSGIWLGDPTTGHQAFFLGPDRVSYRRKVGDRCFNCKVISIQTDRVVFEEYQTDAGGKPRPPKTVTMFIDRRPKL